MKKCLLFLFTALSLLLVPAAMKAQTTVTIGDESSTESHWQVPVNMYYHYSMTQQIYTADEINMPNGGTITSISFDYAYTEAFSKSGVQVYMKNVSKSTFDDNTDMMEVGSQDKVFEGTFSASGAGWVTLTLNTPFHYDGTSNLLVCFYDPTYGYPGSSYTFRTTSTATTHPDQYLTLAWYSDTQLPDLDDLSSFTGNQYRQNYRANIKMTVNPDITEINITGFLAPIWGGHPNFVLSTPLSEHYNIETSLCHWQDITNTPVNIFSPYIFEEEGHDYAMTIYIGADNDYRFANNVTVYINGGAELVKTKYSDGAYYVAQTIPFHTTQGSVVSIGDGNSSTSLTPYYSFYYYSFVEQIYTADEIGMPAGGNISCIRFNMESANEQTNHITVYMKNVTRSQFPDVAFYETVTADDIVYEGDYTFANGWNSIPLNTLFHYNGTDNLMVAIHEDTPGYQIRYFYYTPKENAVVSFHSDSSNPDPYNLSSYSGYSFTSEKRANIKMDFHQLEPTVQIGEGTGTDGGFLPTDVYYNYSLTEQIYTGAEIGRSGVISSLAFYNTGDMRTRNIDIYMVNTNKSSFSDSYDWTAVSSSDLVFSGVVSFLTNVWTTIELTHPFSYSSANNLLIVVDDNTGTYSPYVEFLAYDAPSQALLNYDDDTNFDPSSPTYSGEVFDVKNQIRLGFETTSCHKPTNLTVSNIGKTSATLTWEAPSDSYEWSVQYSTAPDFSNFNGSLAIDRTFNLSNLTPETTYYVRVQSSCYGIGMSEWGSTVSFTTLEACAEPADLTVTDIAPNGAEITWTGDGESYNLRYVTYSGQPLSYDNDEWYTNWGAGGEVTWAVMYPAAMLSGYNTLTNVSIYENSTNTADITVKIYSGGDDAPGMLLYTETVTPQGGDLFHDIFLASPVTIDPTQNLWISLTENDSYPIASCLGSEPNNEWIYYPDSWQLLSDLGYPGYGWMIRATITDGTLLNWTTLSDVTSPQTLTGLTPLTHYTVQVQSDCGSFGTSGWTSSSFNTLEACPVPFDLNVTDLTFNSADIEWTGFGEEYTVNYRPLSIAFSDDFENGLGQWTTVDNDGDGHNWIDISTIGSVYSAYASLDLTDEAFHGSNAALSGSFINGVGILSPDNWLITPQVPLGGLVSFWARGLDGGYYREHFAVYVSTTGTDPADFTQVSEEFVANYDYTNYVVDLSSFDGQQGYVAIRHFNVTDQYLLSVDDFVIYDGSPWQTVITPTESIHLSDLTSSTDYQVMVQSNCGSDGISGWSEALTFHTPEEVTVFDGTAKNSYVPVYGFYTDAYLKAEYIMNASELTAMNYSDITEMTFYAQQSNISWGDAYFKVFMKEVPYTTLSDYTGYSDAVVVYEGPLSIVNGKMIVHFTTPYHYNGDHLLVGFYNTAEGEYQSCTWIGTNVSGASVQGHDYNSLDYVPANQRDFVPKTTFEYVPSTVPSCLKPIDLAVNNVTYSGAELSWNETGTATDWVIEYGTAIDFSGASTVNATTIPTYLLSGLTETTTYYVHVKADCGGGDESSWSYTFSFTTPEKCPTPSNLDISNVGKYSAMLSWTENGEATAWQICLDGDESNPIDVTENPYTLDGLTPDMFYFVKVRANCGGSEGVSAWSNEDAFTTLPLCIEPSNLAISNIGNHSATISWTDNDEATAWQICLDGDESNPIDVTENPYTLIGLTPSTTYSVKVRANCGGSNGMSYWSYEESFTTMEPCPTVLGLSATNITSNSADIEWTGFGEEYTVRFKPLLVSFSDDFEDGLGKWTQIDADGDGYLWILGSNLMASSGFYPYEGSDIVCSQSYDNGGIILYPDNYLVTSQLTLGGTVSFWAKAQDPSYPAEHFGIAVSTTGNTDATDFTTIAEWTMDAGGWQQFTVDLSPYAGQTGYVALRHFNVHDQFYLDIDNFVIYDDNGPWDITYVTTENVHLDGLTPTTPYLVQVQSDCGSDGSSGWCDILNFTTLETCPTPKNLTVSNITSDGADLEWTVVGSGTEWQICVDGDEDNLITVDTTFYTLTGFLPWTSHTVKVRTNCGSDGVSHWSKVVNITTSPVIHSTANWYSNAYSVTGESWHNHYVNFSMQDPSTLTTATSDVVSSIYAGAYADGYMWYIDHSDGHLGRAVVDNDNHTISNFESIIADYDSDGALSMSYNPVDGRMYYVNGDFKLKSFHPEQPTMVEEIGTLINQIFALAINNEGKAFGVEYSTGDLYRVDLTDASATLVGFTGHECVYIQDMAFDIETGELFWGQYYSTSNNGIYLVDTATAQTYLIGRLGGSYGGELTSLFMVGNTTPCPAPTDLIVSNTTKHTAELSWTENGTATEWQFAISSNGTDTIDILSNPWILDGLDPETEYLVKVRANCGSNVFSDWSNEVIFITEVGCQTPDNLTVVDATYSTATLNWTGEGENFTVEYEILGSGEWDTIEEILPPLTITGLQPGTDYEVHVMGNCDADGMSLWSNIVEFSTPLCPIPINLEVSNTTKHTADLNWMEIGTATEWQINLSDGIDNVIIPVTDIPSYTLTGLDAYTEYTVMVQSNCEGAWSGWGDMVIFITELGCLPTTDLAATDATNSSVTLTWTGEGETFHLQYRPASGDWETIDNVTSPYVLDGLLSGTDYEVQVMNDCGADGVSDWSNSVTFTTLLCPIPTDIEVTNVGKHTATVSWTENGSATEWQILVTSDVFDTLTVTENPYTLIDLAAETEYTVKVRANCSGAWSDWSDMTIFTTPIGCQATSDLAWTAVSQSSATLTWTGEGESFFLQYKADGEEWETIDDVTSPYTLTGLQSNTEYMVQVMNNCGADGVSNWSNTVTFTTSLCPTPSNLSATNVDKHTATLGWTETGEATEWQIMLMSSDTNIIDVTANPYTLNELADGTEYTAKVRANCGGTWSNWSDQETFTTLIGCPATDNLAVTAFTQTTATLEWTGEGTTFNMQYRTSGGEWTTINSVTSPYILSGLTPSTSYEAQVQNDCGLEGTSEWSNLATFTTSACDPQAIPYAYDFEAEDPFYCWSVVTGNVQRLHALPSQNHTTDGEYSLAFNESASDVIAFPQFTQEVNTLQVSFWVRPHNNTMSGNGTFAVGYLTDVNDASTFTAVSTYSYDEWPGTYEFMRKIVTLQDAPAGATIAFRHDSPTADGSWYVDDILVSAICNVPTGITVSNITNNSATVTWTDNGAGSWDVTRTNLENFAHNVTTNEYTFTELNPGTEYFIKVRSRCGDDIISNWSEVVSFTTLTNSIPTYVDITGDSIVCHLSTTLLTANTDVPATYLWSNGATTQQINVGAGTYQVTVTSATGDELASEPFVLTEIPSFATQESRSICPNELPYTWNDHTFTETGMEHVTLTAANGCDSIVTMILTVNPSYNDTIEVSTCEGEGYIFNGEYLYESGYYVDSLQTINGCDSVVVLSLTVNPMYAIKAVETICSSELPYEWNGVTFNEEGTQVAQFETVNGCDSLIVMTLYVNPSYSDTIVANICAGDAYNFYGQLLTSSGEYTHPMQTVDGCDSVEVLALTVNPTHSVTEERTVCSIALPYTWNGVLFTGPATKYATLHTASGCDSVVTMVLSVSNAFEITETRAVCASELPIVWNGKTFNEAGTQMDTLTASNGCDSIVTMVLTVNTPVNTVTTTESCGAYTWEANGETYTESDTYLYEHQDANGCTQVDTLHLTIHNPVHTAATIESCVVYTWEANGQTYTESNTYLYEHQDAHGCTQVDTLYLTIYNPVNTASSATACGAFTWAANGETYTESDTYLYEHLDVHGCTQVDTLYLTIYNPENTATTAESCGAYTWEANGQTYTESNTYYYEHQDAHGCTQVDTLYLTINTPTNTAITEAACGSYTWATNGQTYTESGTYYYEHQDAHNCTQVDTLYLTINTPVNTATTTTACGSYTWAANGQTYTESDTYYYEHQDANGCTQVDTLYLTINNPVNTVTTDESCGSYTWAANGQTYYVSGEYTYSHQDANGCTQVDTLRLTILQGSSAVLTNLICASELPYEWNGVTFTEAGMQTTTIEAANGCDSVITMVLMVNTPVHHAYTAEACGSYTWVNGNNQTYTTSGDYTYSHQDINGCTQVDTLHLTIFTPAHTAITVAECGSYTWTGGTGVTYTESGDYLYSHQDANGCTQIDTLHLTIFTPTHTAITVAECGSYTWTGGTGVTYTESGNYTYSHQDAHGCTQVDTLHLTIYNPVHTALTVSACGSYTWEANNQAYAVSGDYTYSHQDNHGCTQVDTLHLTILQGSSAVLMNTVCASELPYEWNGVTFTEAGMQTATITAANGCDSVVTMVLMVNTPLNTAISASECGSYTWTANGQTYTASGDYTYSHQDANGCTQVDTLHLTIYNPVHTAVTVSECGDYTWNGQTYTTSGDYTYSHLDVHGCTQVDTLHLTIHNPVHTAVTVSECSSYTWNGQTYTVSGDYTYSHLDANGCTQVDTLHLTIFTPAHSAITVSECGDYTWNGQTYTVSGDYTYSHLDANGCTQVDTLHLTIHNPVHTAITVEECDSYTWTDGNNQNYTTSGTYTYEHQDANGCTQVDTLHLTIHQSATSEFTIATQDSCYTWNGQTYCASGDYVQTLETAFGCDSVVTLHLTTSVGVTVHEMETVFLAPNPTKNISRIMGLETDPVSVDLYDMRGKLVMKASGRELDVTTLPTGLYMVKIYTGERFINLKLVKQ